MKHEVLVNGEKVWEGDGPGETESDEAYCRDTFPAEYRKRPEKGSTDEVTLITGDEVIAVLRAEDAPTPEPEPEVEAEPDIVGSGGAKAEDAVGRGG